MRLAYLCNVYPAVSHSFVRREIEGLEAAGHDVARFSIRPHGDGLKDESDLREAGITQAALGRGIVPLLLAAVALLFSRPVQSLAAFGAVRKLAGPGLNRKVRHVAYWLEAAWLVRRMHQHRIEHLHVHFGTNPTAVAAIARAWGGPPFSFTAHGPDEFDSPAELGLPEKVARAAFVAAISNFGRAQLMRWSDPAHWEKIKIVRCGLDASFLTANPTPVAEKSINLVCVARLSAQKGLPLLIAACDQLRRDGKKFTMTIIGDGEFRQQIEREISDRNLQDVVILAGARSASDVRDFLRQARAFVLPSFAEGLPVVLMEALSLARPVVTTAIAGIPELVDDRCGWLIPAGSESALLEAMTAALDAPAADLTARGMVGRERVLAMHDAARNARLIARYAEESSDLISNR